MNPVMEKMINVRAYNTNDENFIFSSALSGLYYGDSWFSKIKKVIFLKHYRAILKSAVSLPTTHILVASLKEDPNEIKGYSILLNERRALMWVYVRPLWRKKGIGRALVPESVEEVTNLTPLGESILKKYPHITFNPFVS